MKWSAAPLVVSLVVFFAPAEAFPCGAVAPTTEVSTETNATADAQRAVLQLGPDTTRLHVQMEATSPSEGFAWVLPVPKDATLELGERSVFEELDEETTPQVDIVQQTSSGSDMTESDGCGVPVAGSAGGDNQRMADAGTFASNRVDHFGGGKIGDYQYDVIGASDAGAVETWLEDNGYRVPDKLSEAVAPYLQRDMAIAGVRLTGATSERQSPDPLVIESASPKDGEVLYPLAMSSVSAPEVTPIVLYVAADGRYGTSNFESFSLNDVADEMANQVAGGEQADYDAAVDVLREDAGAVVTEYARNVDQNGCISDENCPASINRVVGEKTPYLTRLYLRVPESDLKDFVVAASDDDAKVQPYREVYASAATTDDLVAAAAPGLLVLLGLFGLRRRSFLSRRPEGRGPSAQ